LRHSASICGEQLQNVDIHSEPFRLVNTHCEDKTVEKKKKKKKKKTKVSMGISIVISQIAVCTTGALGVDRDDNTTHSDKSATRKMFNVPPPPSSACCCSHCSAHKMSPCVTVRFVAQFSLFSSSYRSLIDSRALALSAQPSSVAAPAAIPMSSLSTLSALLSSTALSYFPSTSSRHRRSSTRSSLNDTLFFFFFLCCFLVHFSSSRLRQHA
jgi:hypothetical protein